MDEHVITLLAEAEQRADSYIAAHSDISRSQVQRLIGEGRVYVNNAPIDRVSQPLKAGDCVRVVVPAPRECAVTAEDIPIEIVYEDEDIAVINKPQGMVVHPAPGHDSGTLVNGLMYAMDDLSGVGGELRPGIVHRIDRMTSGLLVIAKNDAAHRALSEQFSAHTAHRSYIAVAEGNFREDGGTVDAPIGRHPSDRKRMAVTDKNSRDAVTHWRVLERLNGYTLLALELETGRTHQIRVHMAHLKHPLAGDDVYGRAKRQLGLDGQALHGYRLRLTHPTTGGEMCFYAPVPEWFLAALCRAGSRLSADALEEVLRSL